MFIQHSLNKRVSLLENSKSLSMKLYYGSKDKYLEYKYTLKGNSYLVDFELNSVGFDENFVICPHFEGI